MYLWLEIDQGTLNDGIQLVLMVRRQEVGYFFVIAQTMCRRVKGIIGKVNIGANLQGSCVCVKNENQMFPHIPQFLDVQAGSMFEYNRCQSARKEFLPFWIRATDAPARACHCIGYINIGYGLIRLYRRVYIGCGDIKAPI